MRRLIFIFLGLISLIGLCDAISQGCYFLQAKQEIKNLTAQLRAKKENMPQPKMQFSVSKDKVINSFFSAVRRAGLESQSSTIFPDKNILIEAVLVGNFMQIQHLLNDISRQCLPFMIKQARIEKYAHQLALRLQLSFLKICVRPTPNANFSEQKADPFATPLTQSDDAVLQRYSFKQFKLAGFLQYPQHTIAMVTLPNGNTREISVGDFLGHEQAQLIDIQQQKMILRLNGQEIQLGDVKK